LETNPGNDQAHFVRVKMWHDIGCDTMNEN
jgi:hypothetical protein